MSLTTLRYLKGTEIRVIPLKESLHPRLEILGERCILNAHFFRVFPLTHPNSHISIQDEKGEEYGILEDLATLSPEDRSVISEALDRRYFTPVITKIDALKQDAGMWKFNVQTQRGTTEFYVRNWRDSAHETGVGRWQIQSVDGLRFEIKHLEQLDERSQNLLEQLL